MNRVIGYLVVRYTERKVPKKIKKTKDYLHFGTRVVFEITLSLIPMEGSGTDAQQEGKKMND